MLEISSFFIYDVQFLRYGLRQTEFFVVQGNFLLFYHLPPPSPPLWSQKSGKKKWKKCLEILSCYTYICTINEDHMIYGSWNIRCNRHKFLSFWAIFCPFSPLTTRKIKTLILKKTPRDIIILHICTIWCMFPEIRSATDRIFCHSRPFFKLLTTQRTKIWKN